jgi:D-hydroxyproline dehydrogenase subunit alpha
MPEQTDLAVVGAGPAGLAATVEAANLGLPVTLIDAFSQPGGQYYRQTPAELGGAPDKSAQPLFERVAQKDVRVFTGTSVWGIFPESEGYLLCLYGPLGTPRRLHAKQIILALGAHDRPMPFPGWTLPGVMTAGAALTLVKHQHLLPGRRILLSGSGPLQMVLAKHLLEAGAEVLAILDANRFPWQGWRHAPSVWGQWERLREGWDAWRVILKAGTPFRWGCVVHRVEGDGQVDRAVIGPVQGGASEVLAVDTVCMGHGFTPSVQLVRQAGCQHYYDPIQRVYLPVRDEWLQTTVPGLFVAGDNAGIGGKDVALWEGRLAALGAAHQLARTVASGRVAMVLRELTRQRRFAAALLAMFPASAHLGDLLTDDTIMCRCEEITVGEIRRAVEQGASTLNAVRMVTRAGMGRCQGRQCGGPILEWLAQELDQPAETFGQITPRPPVVPIPLEGLLEDDL